MFKKGEEISGQHKALFAIAGVMIFLSVVDAIKGPSDPKEKKIEVSPTGSLYRNPRLSLIEKIFCRGYQRSLTCGYSFYHPMRREMEAKGKRIREDKAPDGVIVYRGHLKGEKSGFGGRVEFDPDS